MRKILLIMLVLLIPSVFASDVQPIIIMEDSYGSGDTANIYFSVRNEGFKYYDDVGVDIISPLFDSTSYRIALDPRETIRVRSVEVSLPYTSEELTYPINFTATIYPEGDVYLTTKNLVVGESDSDNSIVLRYRSEVIDETQVTVYITIEKLKGGDVTSLTLVNYYDEIKKTIELTEEELIELNDDKYKVVSFSVNIVGMESYGFPIEFEMNYNQDNADFILTKTGEIIFAPELIEIDEEDVVVVEEDEDTDVKGLITDKGIFTRGVVRFIIFIILGIIIAIVIQRYIKYRGKKKFIKETIHELKGEESPVEEKSVLDKAKEKFSSVEVPEPSYDHGAIEEYIKMARKKGKTPTEVKKALIEKGWLEDVVDLYLKQSWQ
jgi:hypothetical protein